MEGITEKFTITVTGNGMTISRGQEERLRFSASEALMLLDILRNEEQKLRQMADEARPIPVQIKL